MPECVFAICSAPDAVAQSVFPQDRADAATQREAAPAGPLGLDIDRCRAFEHELSRALAARGCRVIVVPHVYHLTAAHPAVARLAQPEADLVVGAWLHPRATYWALQAHGVSGELAQQQRDAPAETSSSAQERRCQQARTIHCFDLREFHSATECIEQWQRFVDRSGSASPCEVENVGAEAAGRWYPVLDYSRCVACKQCLEFCMFGVYSLVDETVVATRPDNCKPGCPACARVCPKGAIMFPHHTADPGIAGAPGATISSKPMDVEAFFKSTAPHPSPPDSSAPCKCKKADRDDLDDLIDALDDME